MKVQSITLCLWAILLLSPTPSTAHTRAEANITVTVHSGDAETVANFVYEGDVEVSEEVAIIPDYSLTPEVAQSKAQVLSTMLLEGRGLRTQDGTLCTWQSPIAAVVNRQLYLKAEAHCPGKVTALKWSVSAVDGLSDGLLYLGKLDWDGNQKAFAVDKGAGDITLSSGPSSLTGFIRMGIEHIAAGVDHIFFVLALLLGGGGFIGLLKAVTGFTLGHSITLAIATFGIASPPSRWIESAIALSIVYIATEDLFGRGRRHRWLIAAIFGLIHGFGFAGALRELDLQRGQLVSALLGFNIGVELGQALFVIVLFPLIMLAERAGRTGHWIQRSIMMVILLMGSWWFVRRAFDI